MARRATSFSAPSPAARLLILLGLLVSGSVVVADSRKSRCCRTAPEFWCEPQADAGKPEEEISSPSDEAGSSKITFAAESAATLFDAIPHDNDWLTAQLLYTGEVLSNTRGGLNTNRATRYRGVLDLTVDVDFGGIGGPEGLTAFVAAGQMHGESLSVNHVGDWQYVSNIDSSPFPSLTQLNEYWLRQEFGDIGWIKGGRVDANATFGFADIAGDFLNSSFGQMPTIPLPVWPTQSLGLDGAVNVTDDMTVVAGAYEGNSMAPNWGIPVTGELGWVMLGHVERRTVLGPDELQGTWRLGGWLQTGDWMEITPAPVAETFDENYGFWATGDQLLWSEGPNADSEQGLGAFIELGWSPEDRNFVEHSFGTGLVYRGLISGRDEDSTGVGVTRVEFGSRTTAALGLTPEDTVELYHKFQFRNWLALQPDLQYIANPGGTGTSGDSLVAGVRFEAAF